MVVRWEFFDPVFLETYTMHVNPREGGTPNLEKTVNWDATTAPDGNALIYEGQDRPIELEWTGVILDQIHYTFLESWYQKRRQIQLTDDLGRQYWIYILSFKPTRRRAATRPWKHDYTMRAVVLDWL